MQLFAWSDATKIGPEIAQPRCMAWDPSLSFVALAYSSQVRVASCSISNNALVCIFCCGIPIEIPKNVLSRLRSSISFLY